MKAYIFFMILFLSSTCFSAGWSEQLTIERTFTEDSDTIVVYTTGGDVYTPNCLKDSWILSMSTEDRKNRAYSTVLSALMSGKKIKLWYANECSSWNYHKATAVQILK